MRTISVLFVVPVAQSARWENLIAGEDLSPKEIEIIADVPVKLLRDLGCILTEDAIVLPGDAISKSEDVTVAREDADKSWKRHDACDLTDLATPFDLPISPEDVITELKRLIRA
jgi:hypothetical protein